MRALFAGVLLMICAVGAWRVATVISPDAVSMAVGMLFGVLAGIPTALLMLASGRRRDREDDEREGEDARYRGAPAYPFQPPVIVVAGGQPQQLPAGPNLVTPAPIYPASNAQAWSGGQGGNRVYRLVGEQEEWLER